MEDEKLKNIREYLKLKKIQEEDKSEEMIEEIYNKIIQEINTDAN